MNINILAIESSCDETSASILSAPKLSTDFYEIKSNIIATQVKEHAKYGGVVPELAARLHSENIAPVVQMALKKAKIKKADLTHIAVTSGPGLVPALVVGVEYAKGLATGLGIPLLPVNHMQGHLFSIFEKPQEIKFPIASLIVSGGHTQIWLMKNYNNYKLIGETVDDAVGEAFDKVGRLLSLPHPGGVHVEKLAATSPSTINFPRPMINSADYNFSFSGLKTAVRVHMQKNPPKNEAEKAIIAKSFQDASVDVLTHKLLKACKEYNAHTISLGGGVSANNALREKVLNLAKENNYIANIPSKLLCTDNAGMITIAAFYNLINNKKLLKPESILADPNWEIS